MVVWLDRVDVDALISGAEGLIDNRDALLFLGAF